MLWLVFVVVIPVPFFLVEVGMVPAVRLLMLALVHVAIIVAEGSQGAVAVAAALLLTQALAYLLALGWLATRHFRFQ